MPYPIQQTMEHHITVKLNKHLSPESVLRLPAVAISRGFSTTDELVADLLEKDLKRPLGPFRPTKKSGPTPTRRTKKGAKA